MMVSYFVEMHLDISLLFSTSKMDWTETTEKIHLQESVEDYDNLLSVSCPSFCCCLYLEYILIVDRCYQAFRVL